MLIYLIIIIIAYLLGNISTSYIVAKRLTGVDIRTQGSGNAGSTNVLRTLGKKAGALTFVGDVLKGLVAVLIARLIAYGVHMDQSICAYLAVVAVVLGHNYPIILGFKGGKGVATSLGSMLGMNPLIALICLVFFILIVVITKYVSLGSILGIGLSPIIMIINNNTKGLIVTLFLTISVAITHKENIKRILNGTERKVGEKRS